MEAIHLSLAIIGGIVTIIASVGGAWVAVKTLLTRHDEKIDRIEKDIEEIKEERKSIHTDLREMTSLLNKVYNKVGVLDERSKKNGK